MTYEICSTIDSDYINVSLVFAKSFSKHNPELKLNIYCINFSNEKYKEYANKLNPFKNVIPISVTFTDPVDRIDTGEYIDNHVYQRHMHATIYKLKLFSEMTTDYMLYLDVDMLIRKDITPLLQEYTTDFVGREYQLPPNDQGINAGVLIARKGMTNLYKDSFDFFEKRKKNPLPEEYYIFHSGHSITNLPARYNYFRYKNCLELVSDPSIVHFCSISKPFTKSESLDPDHIRWLYEAAATGNYIFFEEWYDIFDSVKEILDSAFVNHTNEIRQFYKQYINISKRQLTKFKRLTKWK